MNFLFPGVVGSALAVRYAKLGKLDESWAAACNAYRTSLCTIVGPSLLDITAETGQSLSFDAARTTVCELGKLNPVRSTVTHVMAEALPRANGASYDILL